MFERPPAVIYIFYTIRNCFFYHLTDKWYYTSRVANKQQQQPVSIFKWLVSSLTHCKRPRVFPERLHTTTMKILIPLAVIWLAAAASIRCDFVEETLTYGQFPANFIWAAATASYQVEGGWNAGGMFPLLNSLSFILFFVGIFHLFDRRLGA